MAPKSSNPTGFSRNVTCARGGEGDADNQTFRWVSPEMRINNRRVEPLTPSPAVDGDGPDAVTGIRAFVHDCISVDCEFHQG